MLKNVILTCAISLAMACSPQSPPRAEHWCGVEALSPEKMSPEVRHRYLVAQVRSLVNRYWLQIPLSGIENGAYPYDSINSAALTEMQTILLEPQSDARDKRFIEKARWAAKHARIVQPDIISQ
jgi:hypothetical protein